MYRLIIWVFVLSISICSTALGQPSTPPQIMPIGTGRTSNQPNQGHIRYYVGVINWVDYEELFPTYKTIVRDNYGRSMTWNLSNASSLALLYMSLPVAETPPIYIYVELYDDTDPESPSVYTSNIVFRPPIEYIMRINVATIPNWQRVEGGNVHLSPEPHEGLNNPGVLSYTQGQVVHLTANPISNHLF